MIFFVYVRLVAICLTVGLAVSLAGQYLVHRRVVHLEETIDRLTDGAAIGPVDVLCGLSMNLSILHDAMVTHCGTVHAVVVPAYQWPEICLNRPPLKFR